MKKTATSLLLALALSSALHAQAATGLISGTVTDPSRMFVANAKLVAVEIYTSSVRSTVTNEHGFL